MRIKKTSNTRALAGKTVNAFSNSTTDAYSCDYVNRFFKKLWHGSFTEGEITVPGLSNYQVIIVLVQGAVYCIGSRYYGLGGIGVYGSYDIATYCYRCTGTGDKMVINEYNKGGSDGNQNQPITDIWGVF